MPKTTEEGRLESQSLWYKYKSAVWLKNSGQTVVVHNAMRVLRSVRYVRGFVYVSVPVTSGRYLYELKMKHPEMSRGEMIQKAIDHNYRNGLAFVERLSRFAVDPVIYPADLVPAHQQWEQAHFQALWLSIIAEKCGELRMSEGWEYSNGGSEEFTHAMQLRLGIPRHPDLLFYNTKESEEEARRRMRSISVYDHRGRDLDIDDGIVALERSLAWIRGHGFEAETLERCRELLRSTKKMIQEGFYQ